MPPVAGDCARKIPEICEQENPSIVNVGVKRVARLRISLHGFAKCFARFWNRWSVGAGLYRWHGMCLLDG